MAVIKITTRSNGENGGVELVVTRETFGMIRQMLHAPTRYLEFTTEDGEEMVLNKVYFVWAKPGPNEGSYSSRSKDY